MKMSNRHWSRSAQIRPSDWSRTQPRTDQSSAGYLFVGVFVHGGYMANMSGDMSVKEKRAPVKGVYRAGYSTLKPSSFPSVHAQKRSVWTILYTPTYP